MIRVIISAIIIDWGDVSIHDNLQDDRQIKNKKTTIKEQYYYE